MFCWNCGYKNDNKSSFCEECGVDLDQGLTNDTKAASEEKNIVVKTVETVPNQSPPNVNQKSAVPKAPMSGKKKEVLIALGVVFAIFVGAYYYGNHYFSYNQQVTRFEKIIKSKDPKKWAQVIESADPSYKVSAENLKKMTNYYKNDNHKEEFSLLISSFDNLNNLNADLKIVKDGKAFFFFEKYKLKIYPAYLTVNTEEQTGIQIEVDGKKHGDGKETEIKIGPLTPGEYEVKGTLNDVSTMSTVNLIRLNNDFFEENSTVTFDLHKVSFLVSSNIDEADVFVDDKKVGTIEDGSAEIKDLVWHQGMTVQVKKNFDKEELSTASREIESDEFLAEDYDKEGYYSELSLQFEDIPTKYDMESFLNGFYYDVSYYTNEFTDLGESEKSDFSKYFENGKENKEYQDFIKFIEGVRSSKEKSRVSGRPTVETFTMIGEDRFQVQYLIEYRTIYQSYDVDDIVQVFRYKKGTFKYDASEDQFQIVDLGGVENFETVDNGGVS